MAESVSCWSWCEESILCVCRLFSRHQSPEALFGLRTSSTFHVIDAVAGGVNLLPLRFEPHYLLRALVPVALKFRNDGNDLHTQRSLEPEWMSALEGERVIHAACGKWYTAAITGVCVWCV